MVFCGKCGTKNPDDNLYCRQCGARLQIDDAPLVQTPKVKAKPNDLTEGIMVVKTGGKGAIMSVIVIAAIAILCVLAWGHIGTSDQDSGLEPGYTMDPLDGTFVLSGSATTSDGSTTYSGTVTFRFDDGKLIDRSVNIQTISNPDPGIVLSPPTIDRVNFPESTMMTPPPLLHALGFMDSMRYYSPFLKDMDDTGTTRTVYYNGGGLTGYGFKDSNGDKFFVSTDGKLASYCNTDYSVPIYFNLT